MEARRGGVDGLIGRGEGGGDAPASGGAGCSGKVREWWWPARCERGRPEGNGEEKWGSAALRRDGLGRDARRLRVVCSSTRRYRFRL